MAPWRALYRRCGQRAGRGRLRWCRRSRVGLRAPVDGESTGRAPHRAAQLLLTLADDNAPLAQRARGHDGFCQALLDLTAAVPGGDRGEPLYLRVVGAGTRRRRQCPTRARWATCSLWAAAQGQSARIPRSGILLALRPVVQATLGMDPVIVAVPVLAMALRTSSTDLVAAARTSLQAIHVDEPVRTCAPCGRAPMRSEQRAHGAPP